MQYRQAKFREKNKNVDIEIPKTSPRLEYIFKMQLNNTT